MENFHYLTSPIYPIDEVYVNDYDVYILYNSIRLHFQTKNYDAIFYNYKSNFTYETYKKVSMNEVNMYAKWAHHYQTKQNLLIALVAHFYYNRPSYAAESYPDSERVKDSYNNLKQFLQSPKHFVTKDLTYIKENCTIDIIRTANKNIPKIYPLAMKGLIRLESLIVIDVSIKLTKYIDTKIDSLSWKSFKSDYSKYSKFICSSVDAELVDIIKTTIKSL